MRRYGFDCCYCYGVDDCDDYGGSVGDDMVNDFDYGWRALVLLVLSLLILPW